MIHEREVRSKIAAVLRNEISLVDFERWIMSNSWNMHKDSSASAVNLASEIHLLLAERDDSQIDDRAFLRELALLLNNIVVAQPVDASVAQRQYFAVPTVASSVPWFPQALDLVVAA